MLKKDRIANTWNTHQPACKSSETTHYDFKDHEIINLMLVRKKTEINCQYEHESQVETEQQEDPKNEIQREALKKVLRKMKIKSYQCKLKLKMKNLKDYSFTSFNIWFARTRTQREIT